MRRVRKGPSRRNTDIQMQLAAPAIIVKAIGDIGVLLHLDDVNARADRMNSSRRDVKEISRINRKPLHQIDDRTVECRLSEHL